MQSISVAIISLNEETRLSTCLASVVSFADEIIIVDSGSTDRTIHIAKEYGAHVIHENWQGFGKQKNIALSYTSHEWVFCLDCDEVVSSELQKSILAFKINTNNQINPAILFKVPRANYFLGRKLSFGEGYPDYNIRLFNKNYAHWSSHPVHEHVVPINFSHAKIQKLSGDLLHYSEETIAKYIEKQNRYTSIQATEWIEQDKRAHPSKLIISPLFRFIKMYIFKQGFRDGLPGFIHIAIGCFFTAVKHIKHYEAKNHNAKQPKNPI